MTHEREIERVLDRWLVDGPTEVPDRAFDVVIDRIERQSQRPAWRLLRRDSFVPAYLKPVAAIAAVILVAVVGFDLLPSGPLGIGGPGPSPSPSPTPSLSPSPTPVQLQTQEWEALPAGTYIHDRSTPAVTMEIPDGWWLTVEVAWGFGVRPEAYTVDEGSRVWYDMRATRNEPGCPEAADPAIGHKAADLIAEFTTRPGIVATEPRSITVGGLDGLWTDLTLGPTWTGACPFDPTRPAVTLFTDEDPTSGGGTPFWGISGSEHLRIIALEDGQGSNVMIVLSAGDGDRFDAMAPVVMPVIETFEFDVP